MVWEAGPRQVAVMVALMLVESVIPVATVWMGKMVVDTLASIPRGTPAGVERGGAALLPLGVLYVTIMAVRHLLVPVRALVQGQLNDLLVAHVNTRLIAKANSFADVTPFEDAQFYDRLQTIQRDAAWRPINLLACSTQIFHQGIVLTSMVLILARYHPGLDHL